MAEPTVKLDARYVLAGSNSTQTVAASPTFSGDPIFTGTTQWGSTTTAALALGGGTSTTPYAMGTTANKNLIGFWATTTATSGDSRGMYLRLYFSGAGVSGEAARIFGTINNVTAATGGTVNGAHISLGTSGASAAVSGAANALRATFGIAAASTNIGGTCSVIQVDTDIASGVTVPSNFAFIRFTNTGAGTAPSNLLRLPSAPANGTILATHDTDAMTHSIRIVDSAGTAFYIMCTTTASNRD